MRVKFLPNATHKILTQIHRIPTSARPSVLDSAIMRSITNNQWPHDRYNTRGHWRYSKSISGVRYSRVSLIPPGTTGVQETLYSQYRMTRIIMLSHKGNYSGEANARIAFLSKFFKSKLNEMN